MLYIEDFLELIEPFPQEIRERLTEMREIDLQIQNETDKLDDRIQVFFHQCKRQKLDWKNENYEEIRREYTKLLESAEDKVQIANQLYDLIEKYLKKLDQELQKFKLELEADHAGITSKLEQVVSSHTTNETSPNNLLNQTNMGGSSLNLDDSDFTLNSSTTNDLMIMMMQQQQQQDQTLSNTTSHKRKHSLIDKNTQILTNTNTTNTNDDDSSSSWNSRLDSTQTKSNATFHFSNNKKISSLIGSTSSGNKKICFSNNRPIDNNLMKLIRNNSSNKRNLLTKPVKTTVKQRKKNKINDYDYEDDEYELKNELDDDNFTDELNEEASETATSENDNVFGGNRNLNNDFYESDNSSDDQMNNNNNNNMDNNEDTTSDELDNKLKLNKRNNQNTNAPTTNNRPFKEDWNSSEDTNERYCICKDISYGDMIMCDNSRCETQWFHFVCVGLNSAPKGKWFCPSCVENKKKRKEKLTINNLNSSQSFISMNNNNNNKPSDTQQQQQQNQHSINPFLSSSSSFAMNFNEKNF